MPRVKEAPRLRLPTASQTSPRCSGAAAVRLTSDLSVTLSCFSDCRQMRREGSHILNSDHLYLVAAVFEQPVSFFVVVVVYIFDRCRH